MDKLDVVACENVDFVDSGSFLVYADILDECNYSCAYCCAEHWRRGCSRRLDLDVFAAWLLRSVPAGRRVNLMLLGGEPTLHPGLLGFCRSNPGFYVDVYTNFSASLELYGQLLACGNVSLTLSYHTVAGCPRCPEKFAQKYMALPREGLGRVSVSVMYENETSAESARAFKLVREAYAERGASMQQLDISTLLSSKTHSISYTPRQLVEFEALHGSLPSKDHELYRARLAGGGATTMSEDELFEQLGSCYFYHWLCSASQACFYVAPDGLVYDCPMCHSYASDSQKYVIGDVYSTRPPKRRQILCPFRYYCNMPEIPKKKVFAR